MSEEIKAAHWRGVERPQVVMHSQLPRFLMVCACFVYVFLLSVCFWLVFLYLCVFPLGCCESVVNTDATHCPESLIFEMTCYLTSGTLNPPLLSQRLF